MTIGGGKCTRLGLPGVVPCAMVLGCLGAVLLCASPTLAQGGDATVASASYAVSVGDVVSVSVLAHPEFSIASARVQSDGTIAYYFGALKVSGLTTESADFERLFRVNVLGVHHCTRAALPSMIAHGGGSIVNLASIASFIAIKDRWAYSMTKGAVLSMTRSTALDFVEHKVRCNCVAPARVHTPFVDGFVARNYPGREDEVKAGLHKYQPVGRMGTPLEVARLCLYLASDEASFVTGAAYPIDGGVMMQ